MPDDNGNFKPGGLVVKGRGGELLHGHRVVTELGRWTATVLGTSEDDRQARLRIDVRQHDPNAFWLEHAPSEGLRLEIQLGTRAMAGEATLLARSPLVIEAVVEVS
jgi:hypothetical protein